MVIQKAKITVCINFFWRKELGWDTTKILAFKNIRNEISEGKENGNKEQYILNKKQNITSLIALSSSMQ